MRCTKVRVFGMIVCAVAAIICSVVCVAVDDSQNPNVEVKTKDFLKTVTIIGELGCPIGTDVEIVAYCERDKMEFYQPQKLYVFELDKKLLKTERIFLVDAVKPLRPNDKPVKIEEGDIFQLEGFESGHFTGAPLPKKSDPLSLYVPAPMREFCYVPEFNYYSAEKVVDKNVKDKVQKLIAEKEKTRNLKNKSSPGS
jgi:hypothetical protein